jgi:hypothetical protein
VSDLTLANLTVRNNFADLNPDVPDNTDHTMAIRGGGDRIIIVNCNIIATGGDTLSLWNTGGGRYYHSGCYFEGYVDYVCPRGYCYISNSDFYGYNKNASIWHDGSGGKDHKLVVRNSYFDGKEFGLGRFHRMSAFYLLDCDFSSELVDNGGINYVGDSLSQDRDKLYYGVRTYYDRCMRETGNYKWHEDNLATAEGSPSRDGINDAWTFSFTWEPEKELQGLLECAFLPQPGYLAKDVDTMPVLSWLAGKNAVTHLVYFGTDPDPAFVAEVSDTSYAVPAKLSSAAKYFWRVDEIRATGDTIQGSVWAFYTKVSSAPAQVSDPYPPVDDDFKLNTVHLQWKANALEVDTFYVYFGSEDSLDLIAKQKNADLYLFDLTGDSIYYWRVDAKNKFGITEGPLWYFNYRIREVSGLDSKFMDGNSLHIYPNPARSAITISLLAAENEALIVSLYDVYGHKIFVKNFGIQHAGESNHTIALDAIGTDAGNGYYFLQIDLGKKSGTFPLIIQ